MGQGTCPLVPALVPEKPAPTFPADPNLFNPRGLTLTPRSGTGNGPLISWMDGSANKEVFRWDANTNFANGPHYHINYKYPIIVDASKYKDHYYPGDKIPPPYDTMYFGGSQ